MASQTVSAIIGSYIKYWYILVVLLLVMVTFHVMFSYPSLLQQETEQGQLYNDSEPICPDFVTSPAESSEQRPNLQTLPCDKPRTLNDRVSWKPVLLPSDLQNMTQCDSILAKHVCQEWILPPSPGPPVLTNPQLISYSQRGQDLLIDELLARKQSGFFIECGAATGEGLSNSLFFERNRNWTGLLIEGNPASFQAIVGKQRNAFLVNACLSTKKTPIQVDFQMAGAIGGIVTNMAQTHRDRVVIENGNNTQTLRVQCLPLASILQAMGVTYIDYFSLDIEGAEIEVLETLPLDDIHIEVFSIEYLVSNNHQAGVEKLQRVKDILVKRHGYRVVALRTEDVILRKVC